MKKMILRWNFKEQGVSGGLDSAGLRKKPAADSSCEHGNESWGFITGGVFLDCLIGNQLLTLIHLLSYIELHKFTLRTRFH